MIRKVHEVCYVQEEDGKNLDNFNKNHDWDFRIEKIDGTFFGSPFPARKKLIFYTRGAIVPYKLGNFLNLPRIKTYWDSSLVVSESKKGLTPGQIIAYRNFLFQNQEHVDSRVLITRKKYSKNSFCKVIKPREDLPRLDLNLTRFSPWNVYDNKNRTTYDVDFEKSAQLISQQPWEDLSSLLREQIFDQIPDRFYTQLTNYLNSN